MLNREELGQVVEAIRKAEGTTSAEIRVCVAQSCKSDPLETARRKFRQLNMQATLQRNAVLLFVAPSAHKAAIVADSGIHEAANGNFWNRVLEEMLACFRENRLCEGLCRGVERVGELMKERYPVSENDANELSNDVVVNENEE